MAWLLYILVLGGLMSVAFDACAKAIIFDLNGVLIDKNALKVAYYLNASDLLSYTLSSATRHFDLEKRCKDFLAYLAEKEKDGQEISSLQLCYGEQPLPRIMNDWLKGKRTTKELIDTMEIYVQEHAHFFLNTTEKKLIRAIATLVEPKTFASVMAPVQAMLKLVQECKRQSDEHGKLKHELFILSNWDKESFELIKKQCPSLFECFKEENIIISGHIGMLKPEPEIFQFVLQKYNIDPKKCIFIDDQPENVEGAKKYGITSILHTKPVTTRKKLVEHGVLHK